MVHNFRRTLTVPVDGGEGKTKKMAGHFRLARGRFNKKGNPHTRLVMSRPKVNRSPYAHRKFKSLYIEVLTGTVTCSAQMVSTKHYPRKATSLNQFLESKQ